MGSTARTYNRRSSRVFEAGSDEGAYRSDLISVGMEMSTVEVEADEAAPQGESYVTTRW